MSGDRVTGSPERIESMDAVQDRTGRWISLGTGMEKEGNDEKGKVV